MQWLSRHNTRAWATSDPKWSDAIINVISYTSLWQWKYLVWERSIGGSLPQPAPLLVAAELCRDNEWLRPGVLPPGRHITAELSLVGNIPSVITSLQQHSQLCAPLKWGIIEAIKGATLINTVVVGLSKKLLNSRRVNAVYSNWILIMQCNRKMDSHYLSVFHKSCCCFRIWSNNAHNSVLVIIDLFSAPSWIYIWTREMPLTK